MGWSLRRSVRFGPLRVNFSKSGIGYSLGVRGARIGKDAQGRVYSQVSIPHTGIYNRQYYKPSPPPSHAIPKLPPGVPAATQVCPLYIIPHQRLNAALRGGPPQPIAQTSPSSFCTRTSGRTTQDTSLMPELRQKLTLAPPTQPPPAAPLFVLAKGSWPSGF
jgi:hypothetical protein